MRAALIGAACGLRTFAGPAALAARRRAPARTLLLVAALGETAADKTPFIPPRTSPPALAGRVLSGALSGRALAGLPGLAAGAAGACAGAFAGGRVRTALADRTGLPAPLLGVAEDAVALAAAALAAR